MPTRPRLALYRGCLCAALVSRSCTGRDVDDAELQFQLGTLLFEETRYPRGARGLPQGDRRRLPRSSPCRRASASSSRRCGSASSARRSAKPASLQARWRRTIAEALVGVRRRAVVGRAVRRGATRNSADALALAPESVARPSRPGPRAGVAEQARRSAERSAGWRSSSSPRDERNPPHRRLDLRAHAPLRAGRRGLQQLRQPAAEQGSQRQGGVVAVADPLPAIVRRARADRASTRASADGLHTVDFRVVDDKVIVKARVNGGRPQDFVLDTGSEQTTISRQTASSAGGAADHLHAQRRRRRSRPARPAARTPRHARDRHAQAEQRPGADQGAGAARHPEARDRELLAARRSACR